MKEHVARNGRKDRPPVVTLMPGDFRALRGGLQIDLSPATVRDEGWWLTVKPSAPARFGAACHGMDLGPQLRIVSLHRSGQNPFPSSPCEYVEYYATSKQFTKQPAFFSNSLESFYSAFTSSFVQ